MDNTTHSALNKAILTLLTPLVRILLRNGIAFNSFAEIARKVFVDVAFRDFQEPGKKQTISRVSALTGLTRKETKRLHETKFGSLTESVQRYNRATRVISGWINDPDYCDTSGKPRLIPMEGAIPSFAELVKKYSGDIPTQAMYTVLEASNCIDKTSEGDVRLIKHAYIPSNDPTDKLRILGTDTAELIATIDHNLQAAPGELYFQRKVSNPSIAITAIPEFREIAANKAQLLLEDLDSWLSQHESGSESDTTTPQSRYVSLGIYYHEQQDHEE